MTGRRILGTALLLLSLTLIGRPAHAEICGKVAVLFKDNAGENRFLALKLACFGSQRFGSGHMAMWEGYNPATSCRPVTSKEKWHMICALLGESTTIDVYPPTETKPAYLTLQIGAETFPPIVPGPDDIFWVDWASLP